MNKKLISLALMGAFATLSGAAFAEDAAPAAATPDWTFPSSVSLVTDYIFRGQSQTWGKPAVQVAIEADHKSGFYAGFFGSNVSDQWLPGAQLETDWYAGFRGALPGAASDFGFDIGGIYYYYPGANWNKSAFVGTNESDLNTFEVYASLSYKWLSLKTGRTLTDYWGWNNNNSGIGGGFANNLAAGVEPGGSTKGSYFYEANASYEVFPSWTISGQVGHQVIADSTGLDVTYYKAGVTKAFASGWSVAAFFSGTNEPSAYERFVSLGDAVDTSDVARTTGFISVTKGF